MANDCNYELKISGKTKESILEFAKILKNEYDYSTFDLPERHFLRIREVEYSEDTIEEYNGVYSLVVDGYCAWSTKVCFSNGIWSYYKRFNQRFRNASRATCIQNECKRLNVFVEIFSEELGCMFQEHVICSPRGIIKSEHKNIEDMYDEDNHLVNPEIGYDWEYKEFTLEDFDKYKAISRNRSKSRRRYKRKLKKHKK